eukprot:3446041-Pyramimonas_sp.AAC.1
MPYLQHPIITLHNAASEKNHKPPPHRRKSSASPCNANPHGNPNSDETRGYITTHTNCIEHARCMQSSDWSSCAEESYPAAHTNTP